MAVEVKLTETEIRAIERLLKHSAVEVKVENGKIVIVRVTKTRIKTE